jgi:hypothetical protein
MSTASLAGKLPHAKRETKASGKSNEYNLLRKL